MVLMKDGYNALVGPQDLKRALPLAGLAVKDSLLKEKPSLIKRALRAVLKAHRFIFDNQQETILYHQAMVEPAAGYRVTRL
jgi:hypothetical protein